MVGASLHGRTTMEVVTILVVFVMVVYIAAIFVIIVADVVWLII